MNPKAAKSTVSDLGIDLAAQAWHRSGHGDGVIEVAFSQGPDNSQWVLMRVAGDPDQRVLVFDRHEWECFLDGARNGEFDAAAALGSPGVLQLATRARPHVAAYAILRLST